MENDAFATVPRFRHIPIDYLNIESSMPENMFLTQPRVTEVHIAFDGRNYHDSRPWEDICGPSEYDYGPIDGIKYYRS